MLVTYLSIYLGGNLMSGSDWWLLIFGSGGLITLVGYLLKNKEGNRSATLAEFSALDERLKAEIRRLDKRVDEAEDEANKWKEKAGKFEEENKVLIEENNWYQTRVEELEDRVGKLEEELEKERTV